MWLGARTVPLLALVLALLWSQALGLWHGTQHAPGLTARGPLVAGLDADTHGHSRPLQTLPVPAHPTAQVAEDAPSPQASGSDLHRSATGLSPDAGWIDEHTAGDRDCRLLDQLLHVDALATPSDPAPAGAGAERPEPAVVVEAPRQAGWRPPARGPPAA